MAVSERSLPRLTYSSYDRRVKGTPHSAINFPGFIRNIFLITTFRSRLKLRISRRISRTPHDRMACGALSVTSIRSAMVSHSSFLITRYHDQAGRSRRGSGKQGGPEFRYFLSYGKRGWSAGSGPKKKTPEIVDETSRWITCLPPEETGSSSGSGTSFVRKS